MRPTAVLIAIVFGSAVAIGFGLITTGVVFAVLRAEHPELAHELRTLVASCLWFAGLGAISGAALYATLKHLRWRAYAQAATVLMLLAVGFAYWPKK
jgi:NhaP-type Na+/H+ or K+/H+ antiporter